LTGLSDALDSLRKSKSQTKGRVFVHLKIRNGLLVVLILLFAANSMFATDGYFLTGYGVKQQGQGGAGVAFPGDGLAGATNPAGLLFVGDRIDFGLTLFRPTRYGIIADNGGSDANVVYDANRAKNFYLPELGYSHLLRPNTALGVTLYGNGGMNTPYTVPIPLLGTSRGGVDLQQLFVSPTLAYKVDKHNSLGLAVNIAYQCFAAEGLQDFAAPSPPYQVSSDPAHVTNTGQAVSHMQTDVQVFDCDFYVFSGHKMFAPAGIGVVCRKTDALENSPPWQGGGNMIQDVTFEKTTYQPPGRFEAGTGNIADAVGLGAAIDYLERVGMVNISRYEHDLLAYATESLQRIPGLRLIGTAKEKAGVLSFVLDGYRTEDVGAALNRQGIAVRAGHHCAQPILRRFGVESTVRPSLALYNTCEEIDAPTTAVWNLKLGHNSI
jgi:hypothetical protein